MTAALPVTLGLRELTRDDARVASGEEFKRARERLGLTQPELAERVGVTPDTISNWERGLRQPKNKLGKLRAVLHLDDPEPTHPAEPPARDEPTELTDRSDFELAALLHVITAEITSRLARSEHEHHPKLPGENLRLPRVVDPPTDQQQRESNG